MALHAMTYPEKDAELESDSDLAEETPASVNKEMTGIKDE